MLMVTVYVATWTGVNMPHVVYSIDSHNMVQARCSRNWWNFAVLISELIFVLWGVVMCIRVHKVPLFFNESRWIGITVYNWLFVFGMAEVLLITLAELSPDAALAIQACAVLFAGMCAAKRPLCAYDRARQSTRGRAQ